MDNTGEFHSVVTDIRLAQQSGRTAIWWMSLHQTGFSPGDEGVLQAETRSGTRLFIPVSKTLVDEDGVVWHVVEKPLAAGTDVVGRVFSQA